MYKITMIIENSAGNAEYKTRSIHGTQERAATKKEAEIIARSWARELKQQKKYICSYFIKEVKEND